MTDLLPPPPAVDEIELKLRGLERLRTAGMVTPAEYERVRAKLLAAGGPAAPQPSAWAPAPRQGSRVSVVDLQAPGVPQPAPMPPPRYSFGPPAAPPAPEASPSAAGLPGRRRSHLGLIAGIAVAGLLAGSAAAYLAFSRKPAPSTSASSGAPSAPAGGSAANASTTTYATIADFVPDAKAFVEAHRGLAWHSDVSVVGLDDAAFVAKLQGGRPVGTSSSAGSADDIATREFKALHLIPASTDLGSAGSTAAAAGVVGFYDYNTKELYVRGTQPTPYVREVIIHELTHALQDQWFGLAKLYQRNDIGGESVEAFTAVVEGDAVRIERQYVQSLPADQQQKAQADSGGSTQQQQQLSSVPPALLTLMSFPYGGGLQFDQALIDARGQSSLDAAFRTPPTTTAEILDPQRYLDGIHDVTIAVPSPAGTEFDRGTLGSLGFLMMFASQPGGGSQAALNASAWGGDSYVAYSSGRLSCIRDSATGISAVATSVLDAALKQWMAATPSASLTSGSLNGSGTVTFTVCG